jgi:hypothetical protein
LIAAAGYSWPEAFLIEWRFGGGDDESITHLIDAACVP